MKFIMIYITHPDEATAKSVTQALIHEKLVACGNIFPIKSAYWWQEVIEQGDEFVSIVKTVSENWEAVQKRVEALHPYDVPCIIKIEVESNEAYAKWIREETLGKEK